MHIKLTYEEITLEWVLPLLRLRMKQPHLRSYYPFYGFSNTFLCTLLYLLSYNHISLYLITPTFIMSWWLLFPAFSLNILAFIIHTLILSIVAVSQFIRCALIHLLYFTNVTFIPSDLFPLFLYLNIVFCTQENATKCISLSNNHWKTLPPF